MSTAKWRDLSPSRRRFYVALGAVQVLLQAAALVDLTRREPQRVRGPRWMWAGLSFVNFFGPLAYFLWGRKPAEEPP